MEIVRSTDVVQFTDEAGDTLVLLVSPKHRDVVACDELESREAMKGLAELKAQGIDTDAILAEAEKDPEAIRKAREGSDDTPDSPKVRRFKLEALAPKLIVAGETIGGGAVLDAYDDMKPRSARWVDSKVEEVWASSKPSEADTQGQGTDAEGAGVTGISAT